MQDDQLTPDEAAAVAALPREIAPPAGLEDRVTASVMRGNAGRGPGWKTFVLRTAAAVVLFLAGLVAGRTTAAAPDPADGRPRYLLLLYGEATVSPPPIPVLVEEYSVWARTLKASGHLITAEKLGRVQDIIGPAALVPRPPGAPNGFFYIRASSRAEATAIANACPHIRYGGAVEVRPIE